MALLFALLSGARSTSHGSASKRRVRVWRPISEALDALQVGACAGRMAILRVAGVGFPLRGPQGRSGIPTSMRCRCAGRMECAAVARLSPVPNAPLACPPHVCAYARGLGACAPMRTCRHSTSNLRHASNLRQSLAIPSTVSDRLTVHRCTRATMRATRFPIMPGPARRRCRMVVAGLCWLGQLTGLPRRSTLVRATQRRGAQCA